MIIPKTTIDEALDGDRLTGAFPTMADLDLLTSRQKEIYEFIREKIQGRGYGPTVREIGNRFGIRSPNGVMCHLKALQKKGLIHREPHMSCAIQLLDDPVSPAHNLKLRGRIAAGQPLEAIENAEDFSIEEWEKNDETFVLQVTGESMIDAHIADGDYAVIKKTDQARDGQIAAVLDDDDNATLKCVYRDRRGVRLSPPINR